MQASVIEGVVFILASVTLYWSAKKLSEEEM